MHLQCSTCLPKVSAVCLGLTGQGEDSRCRAHALFAKCIHSVEPAVPSWEAADKRRAKEVFRA